MGESREPSDEFLMQRVGGGDHDALGTLFTRHHSRVYTLCYRYTGDVATAEDLMQESFLRVLRYGNSFRGRARFTTWLHRLVRNVCMDHMTANERETQRRAGLAHELAGGGKSVPECDERRDRLREALYRLAPDKRDVLVLSRYENLRYREIAEVCEITVDAVKARAHRALRELRRIYDELEQEA